MEQRIVSVVPGSIAEEMEIEAGDVLVSVNGQMPEDVFDYRYLINEEQLLVLIRKPDGEEWELEIEKEYEDDLGIEFENGLMDEYRSCRNKCIFCFIDQLPKGMRETLYFKDDDSRLSFLQGNYLTLTNMSDHDIDRIIRYKLSPINISFHTTNPELRCRMLHNRFAGEVFGKVRRLKEAGIEMNGQIVLCKGVNDGEELERSIRDLSGYMPELQSVSVVPVDSPDTGKDYIRWNRLNGKMPAEYWTVSTGGRKNFSGNLELTLSMGETSGTFLQKDRCRQKRLMTVICSWKTAWVWCVCWTKKFAKLFHILRGTTESVM